MIKNLFAAFFLMTSNSLVLSQGLDSLQEKRVLKDTVENPNLRPDNSSGLDMKQEQRLQSDKYAPISGAKPSGGGLEDAEMEQRGLQNK